MTHLAALCISWDLENPDLLRRTPSAEIYRVRARGEDAILKVFSRLARRELESSSLALEAFSGVGSVRLLRSNESAQLLEYLGGETLHSHLGKSGDDASTGILADVAILLHSRSGPSPAVFTLREWYRSLFAMRERDPFFADAAMVAEELLSTPSDERLLHGDLHHDNILHTPRGWLGIDPKGIYGERTFDAANALFNPVALPERVKDPVRLRRVGRILSERLSLDLKRLFAFGFTYGCLSACWHRESGESDALPVAVARVLRDWI